MFGKYVNKSFIIVLVLFFFAIISLALVSRFVFGDVVVAKVGDKEIKLSQYKERLFAMTGMGSPQNPTGQNKYNKETVLNDLIRGALIESESKNRNLEADKNSIEKYLNENVPEYKKATKETEKDAYRELAKQRVLENILSDKLQNWREGYYLLCRYDRYLQDDYLTKIKEGETLRDKQKAYAKDYCEKMKIRLEGGTSSFEEELSKLKSDVTIGDASWEPFNMTLGRKFDKETFDKGQLVLGTNLYDKISRLELKKGWNILTVDTYKNAEESKDPVDGLYAVVYLGGEGNRAESENFDIWMEELIKKSNIIKYLDRIEL